MQDLNALFDEYHANHDRHQTFLSFWKSLDPDKQAQTLEKIKSALSEDKLNINVEDLGCDTEIQFAYFHTPFNELIKAGETKELDFQDPDDYTLQRARFSVDQHGQGQVVWHGIVYRVSHPQSWDSVDKKHYTNFQQLVYNPNIPDELEYRYRFFYLGDIHELIRTRNYTALVNKLELDPTTIGLISIAQWHELLTDLRENRFILKLVSVGSLILIEGIVGFLSKKFPPTILRSMLSVMPSGQKPCTMILKERFRDAQSLHEIFEPASTPQHDNLQSVDTHQTSIHQSVNYSLAYLTQRFADIHKIIGIKIDGDFRIELPLLRLGTFKDKYLKELTDKLNFYSSQNATDLKKSMNEAQPELYSELDAKLFKDDLKVAKRFFTKYSKRTDTLLVGLSLSEIVAITYWALHDEEVIQSRLACMIDYVRHLKESMREYSGGSPIDAPKCDPGIINHLVKAVSYFHPKVMVGFLSPEKLLQEARTLIYDKLLQMVEANGSQNATEVVQALLAADTKRLSTLISKDALDATVVTGLQKLYPYLTDKNIPIQIKSQSSSLTWPRPGQLADKQLEARFQSLLQTAMLASGASFYPIYLNRFINKQAPLYYVSNERLVYYFEHFVRNHVCAPEALIFDLTFPEWSHAIEMLDYLATTMPHDFPMLKPPFKFGGWSISSSLKEWYQTRLDDLQQAMKPFEGDEQKYKAILQKIFYSSSDNIDLLLSNQAYNLLWMMNPDLSLVISFENKFPAEVKAYILLLTDKYLSDPMELNSTLRMIKAEGCTLSDIIYKRLIETGQLKKFDLSLLDHACLMRLIPECSTLQQVEALLYLMNNHGCDLVYQFLAQDIHVQWSDTEFLFLLKHHGFSLLKLLDPPGLTLKRLIDPKNSMHMEWLWRAYQAGCRAWIEGMVDQIQWPINELIALIRRGDFDLLLRLDPQHTAIKRHFAIQKDCVYALEIINQARLTKPEYFKNINLSDLVVLNDRDVWCALQQKTVDILLCFDPDGIALARYLVKEPSFTWVSHLKFIIESGDTQYFHRLTKQLGFCSEQLVNVLIMAKQWDLVPQIFDYQSAVKHYFEVATDDQFIEAFSYLASVEPKTRGFFLEQVARDNIYNRMLRSGHWECLRVMDWPISEFSNHLVELPPLNFWSAFNLAITKLKGQASPFYPTDMMRFFERDLDFVIKQKLTSVLVSLDPQHTFIIKRLNSIAADHDKRTFIKKLLALSVSHYWYDVLFDKIHSLGYIGAYFPMTARTENDSLDNLLIYACHYNLTALAKKLIRNCLYPFHSRVMRHFLLHVLERLEPPNSNFIKNVLHDLPDEVLVNAWISIDADRPFDPNFRRFIIECNRADFVWSQSTPFLSVCFRYFDAISFEEAWTLLPNARTPQAVKAILTDNQLSSGDFYRFTEICQRLPLNFCWPETLEAVHAWLSPINQVERRAHVMTLFPVVEPLGSLLKTITQTRPSSFAGVDARIELFLLTRHLIQEYHVRKGIFRRIAACLWFFHQVCGATRAVRTLETLINRPHNQLTLECLRNAVREQIDNRRNSNVYRLWSIYARDPAPRETDRMLSKLDTYLTLTVPSLDTASYQF